jgi:hypothetical protein
LITAPTIREPALVDATRLFHHEGRQHPVSLWHVTLSLPALIGDRFYKHHDRLSPGGKFSGPGRSASGTFTAPVAMLFAILPADFAAQEHDGRQLSAHWRRRE